MNDEDFQGCAVAAFLTLVVLALGVVVFLAAVRTSTSH